MTGITRIDGNSGLYSQLSESILSQHAMTNFGDFDVIKRNEREKELQKGSILIILGGKQPLLVISIV